MKNMEPVTSFVRDKPILVNMAMAHEKNYDFCLFLNQHFHY